MILSGVDIGKDMSFWGSLSIVSTTEMLNRGLKTLVIEDSNRRINRERGKGGGQGVKHGVGVYSGG